MKDSIEIINENNLDAKYILEEIRQVEAEKGRKVIKAEFIDIGDNKCKQRFWPRSEMAPRVETRCGVAGGRKREL